MPKVYSKICGTPNGISTNMIFEAVRNCKHVKELVQFCNARMSVIIKFHHFEIPKVYPKGKSQQEQQAISQDSQVERVKV